MKLQNTSLFLALCLCTAVFCGCAEEKDESSGSVPAPPPGDGVHVTIENKSISLADLRAQNYTVPVLVTLDKNTGITYAEWGLQMDPRCTFTASADEADLPVYYSINEDINFLWTAWAAGNAVTTTGSMLELQVTLPSDAKAGDSYTITYADVSIADKPHVWKSDENDWVEKNKATWTDGAITVTN